MGPWESVPARQGRAVGRRAGTPGGRGMDGRRRRQGLAEGRGGWPAGGGWRRGHQEARGRMLKERKGGPSGGA